MKIENIMAFIATDPTGEEGICAFLGEHGWVPMVCAGEKRVEGMRPVAQKMATATGQVITLVRFGTREEAEVFMPEPGKLDS